MITSYFAEPRLENVTTSPNTRENGKGDGRSTIEASRPRTGDSDIPNPSDIGSLGETAHFIAASLTTSSGFNVLPLINFDDVRAIESDPQVFVGEANTQNLRSIQSTLSVPENVSGVMDEFALDRNFHAMTGTNDVFYEMSNLDYL
jgi:hypothetical protein